MVALPVKNPGNPSSSVNKPSKEFARKPEWCHVFPSQGQQSTYYPYGHATNRTMAARTSRATTLDTSFPIYPSDTDDFCLDIVYCFYTHVKYSIIPFPAYLFFCSYLPAQKTLRTHMRLDEFTRSFSNLHELIGHFSTFTCSSAKLKTLRQQLFNEAYNANEALRSLHKIQESFDQRSNLQWLPCL